MNLTQRCISSFTLSAGLFSPWTSFLSFLAHQKLNSGVADASVVHMQAFLPALLNLCLSSADFLFIIVHLFPGRHLYKLLPL